MSSHLVSRAEKLSNRRLQQPSGTKPTTKTHLSVVNVRQIAPGSSKPSYGHLSTSKEKFHIITVSPQSSQLFDLSLNLYLSLFTSSEDAEIGTFAFTGHSNNKF